MTTTVDLLGLDSLLIPISVLAHALEPGVAGGYVAMIHSLSETPVPLVLLTIGLLIGFQKTGNVPQALLALASGTLIGLDIVMANGMIFNPEPPLLGTSLAAGVLVGLGTTLPRTILITYCLIVGFFYGAFSAPGLISWAEGIYYAVGIITGLFIVVGASVGAVKTLKQLALPWFSIGVRIVGSWLAAITALALALALR